MNDENGGNGRRRRNRNAAIGGVTQAERPLNFVDPKTQNQNEEGVKENA